MPPQQQACIVDPYQVLQIRRDATNVEIRHAYRRLALWHHPGRRMGEDCSASSSSPLSSQSSSRQYRRQVFETLAACYETLVDREARRRIDVLLRADGTQNWPAGDVRIGRQRDPHRRSSCTASHAKINGNTNSEPRIPFTTTSKQPLPPPPLTHSSSSSQSSSHSGHSANDEEDESLTLLNTDQDQCSLTAAEEEFFTTRDETEFLEESCTVFHTTTNDWMRTYYPCSKKEEKVGEDEPQEITRVRFLPCGHPSMDDGDEESDADCTTNTNGTTGDTAPDRGTSPNASSKFLIPNRSTSTEVTGPEIHYTSIDTNRLFGGPLKLLYRARRWKPFTNPFVVFQSVFGTALSFGEPATSTNETRCGDADGSNVATAGTWLTTAPMTTPKLLVPSPHHASLSMTVSTEHLPDGTVIHRTCRLLNNRKITRTEYVEQDPETGQRRIRLTVASEEIRSAYDSYENDPCHSTTSSSYEYCFFCYFCFDPSEIIWPPCENNTNNNSPSSLDGGSCHFWPIWSE